MARIYVEGRPHEVDGSENLLSVCLSLGYEVPYFCWHPALGSVGACRQCAVKVFRDEKDERGRVVMSCLEPIQEGMRVSITDPEALSFRATVIEWLMANHPHDCPICDEGGECHLQDMTIMAGHVYRRFRFPKRTYRNQDLGPFVNHEMNRCIQCYRCVRYYRDYAGGRDLADFGVRDRVYFGRHEDGRLESEFSGNLIEICPTGVFTDKTLKRHFVRKWDLSTAPSVCVHCGLGCNIIPGARNGELRRISNRYNGEVNGYFLCDRGRYGYEFVTGQTRVLESRNKRRPPFQRTASSTRDLVLSLSDLVSRGCRPLGIGSPRASLEANFALRDLVGKERFFAGISAREGTLMSLALKILRTGTAQSTSLAEACSSDAVLILAEDPTNTAPMLALALRQAARRKPLARAVRAKIPLWHDLAVRELLQDATGPVFVLNPRKTKLAEVGTEAILPLDEISLVGHRVANRLRGAKDAASGQNPEIDSLVALIADALAASAQPLIVAGTSSGSEDILKAAANTAWALGGRGLPAKLSFVMPECDSLGLALFDAPSLDEAFRRAKEMETETLIILENDLFRRTDHRSLDEFLSRFRNVIALDHTETPTTRKAHILLAAAAYPETDGTLVNSEGRAQRFFRVYPPPSQIRPSWEWLSDISSRVRQEHNGGEPRFDEVARSMAESVPALARAAEAAPSADFRIHGLKISREPARASGRTALRANIDVSEPRPPDDLDSPYAFSMEGHAGQAPASVLPRYWSPGWNSVQALNKFQARIGGPLRGGDAGIRLIEPTSGVPEPFPSKRVAESSSGAEAKGLSAIGVFHIFGSEELSSLSRGIAPLIPEAVLLIGPDDASERGIEDDSLVEIEVKGQRRVLHARLTPDIARGHVGVPIGLPGMEWLDVPGEAKIRLVPK